MGESAVTPQPFSGKSSEDAGNWLRHFENYCTYKVLTDVQKQNLFRVLMTGSAADWLENVRFEDVNNVTFNNYKTAFEARYKVPEIMRFKLARELFSRPQGEDENVDDYVIQMQKLGKVVGINEEMLNYAILNGLKAHIANFVTQKAPRNIDELLSAARMTELTIPAPRDDSLHAKVDKLMSTWNKMTTSSVQERRSPIPQRRVNFEDNTRSQNRTPQRSSNWNQGYTPRPGFIPRLQRPWQRPTQPRTTFRVPDSGQVRDGIYQPRYPIPQTTSSRQRMEQVGEGRKCMKCGYKEHTNINLCPAVNQNCWICGRWGHFSRVCRLSQQINQEF